MPCTIVLIFLYILLMPKIGFTIATFCFLTLQITLLSTDLSAKSWLKSLLIALIAALVIYIIFGCAFGLAVPKVSFVDLGLGNLYRRISVSIHSFKCCDGFLIFPCLLQCYRVPIMAFRNKYKYGQKYSSSDYDR